MFRALYPGKKFKLFVVFSFFVLYRAMPKRC